MCNIWKSNRNHWEVKLHSTKVYICNKFVPWIDGPNLSRNKPFTYTKKEVTFPEISNHHLYFVYLSIQLCSPTAFEELNYTTMWPHFYTWRNPTVANNGIVFSLYNKRTRGCGEGGKKLDKLGKRTFLNGSQWKQ